VEDWERQEERKRAYKEKEKEHTERRGIVSKQPSSTAEIR
jgi:hypothetical protein